MLRIRPEQRQAFRDAAEEARLASFRRLLPEQYPGLCVALGEEGVRRWVAKGVRKARAHGMAKTANVQRFVHLMFQLVDDEFDRNPSVAWAGAILRWPHASEELRLTALEKRAAAEAEKRT